MLCFNLVIEILLVVTSISLLANVSSGIGFNLVIEILLVVTYPIIESD